MKYIVYKSGNFTFHIDEDYILSLEKRGLKPERTTLHDIVPYLHNAHGGAISYDSEGNVDDEWDYYVLEGKHCDPSEYAQKRLEWLFNQKLDNLLSDSSEAPISQPGTLSDNPGKPEKE